MDKRTHSNAEVEIYIEITLVATEFVAKIDKINSVFFSDEDDDQMTPHITLRLVHDDGV